MSTLRSLLVPSLLTLGAFGCAGAAPRTIDANYVARIRPGTTAHAEVRAWFGEPEDVVTTRDPRAVAAGCVEAWHWSHPTRETFQNLTVRFDRAGAVCDAYFSGAPRPRGEVTAVIARSMRSRLVASNGR